MRLFEGYKKGVNLGGWLSQCKHTYEHYDSFITEADIEKAETYLDSLFATLAYYPNKVNAISQIVDSEQLISSGNYIYYDTKQENTVLLLIFDTKKGEMYYFSSEQTG